MIREVTEEVNQKTSLPKHAIGFYLGLFSLVGFLFLISSCVQAQESDPLAKVIEDARKQGGLLIECRSGACHDTETGEPIDYEDERDGYYIVYPDDVYTEKKHKETEKAVKAILQ